MKFEKTMVAGWESAFRGMRNPMNSWAKSDSKHVWPADINGEDHVDGCYFLIGENDMRLAQRLIRGGGEHRKFLRQIQVWVDITAPLYWWKEMDTYKVGTVANSCSTMHKLASTPITVECFEMGDFYGNAVCGENDKGHEVIGVEFAETFISKLEYLRKAYLETKDKRYWKELIRWLPESWLQMRTVSLNYENIRNMAHQRKNHKLSEWSVDFFEWAKELPYADELIFYNGEEENEA